MVPESAVFESLGVFQTLEKLRLRTFERDLIIKFVNELLQQLPFLVRTSSLKSFKDALQQSQLVDDYRTYPTAITAVRIEESSNHIKNDAYDL